MASLGKNFDHRGTKEWVGLRGALCRIWRRIWEWPFGLVTLLKRKPYQEQLLPLSALACSTKAPQAGQLKQQKCTSSQMWDCSPRPKRWQFGFSRGLSLWLTDATFSLSPSSRSIPGASPSSSKDTRHIGSGPSHMTSFSRNHLFKHLISKYSHNLWYQGLGLQHRKFEETQFCLEQLQMFLSVARAASGGET